MTAFIARTPVDLLAVVPFALGFHPEDSVVLLTFTGPDGGPGSFHARVDLPVVVDEQEAVADLLCDIATQHGADRIGLVLYTEDTEAARAFHDLALPRLLAHGVDVVDVLRVDGDRFHDAGDPTDPGVGFDLSAHPFTAAQVMRGRVAHHSRDALADTLIGHDEADRDEIAAAADAIADRLISVGRRARSQARSVPLSVALAGELREEGRWLQRQIRRLVATDVPCTPLVEDAARVLVLVALEPVREVALMEMTRALSEAHLDLWRSLTARAPRDLRSAPAALCAFAAWLHGDGALAWCALERCFEVDPDDALGHHVAALLESATPPTVWTPLRADALRVFGGAESRAADG